PDGGADADHPPVEVDPEELYADGRERGQDRADHAVEESLTDGIGFRLRHGSASGWQHGRSPGTAVPGLRAESFLWRTERLEQLRALGDLLRDGRSQRRALLPQVFKRLGQLGGQF